MKQPKVTLGDGRVVARTPARDGAQDFPDIDHFGEPLVFDEQGNVVSGKPKPPPAPPGAPPAA